MSTIVWIILTLVVSAACSMLVSMLAIRKIEDEYLEILAQIVTILRKEEVARIASDVFDKVCERESK